MSQGYKWMIRRGHGMGGALCPPGHPNLTFEVVEKWRSYVRSAGAVDWAAKEPETVGADVSAAAKRMLDNAQLIRSPLWEAHVYGYFRNCYADGTGSRNVSTAIIYNANMAERPPADRHLAYLLVREYFPDAEPNVEWIEHPERGAYGTRPCAKCGTALQYEARVDAFAEPISARTDCPSGGTHSPSDV